MADGAPDVGVAAEEDDGGGGGAGVGAADGGRGAVDDVVGAVDEDVGAEGGGFGVDTTGFGVTEEGEDGFGATEEDGPRVDVGSCVDEGGSGADDDTSETGASGLDADDGPCSCVTDALVAGETDGLMVSPTSPAVVSAPQAAVNSSVAVVRLARIVRRNMIPPRSW